MQTWLVRVALAVVVVGAALNPRDRTSQAQAATQAPDTGHQLTADVVVYGATPGGIAAALAAADDGLAVLLIEPTHRLGGMVTCGLSHTDFRTFEGLTGAFKTFANAVADHYVARYGADSPQAQGNFGGTHGEPSVNLAVFESLIAQRPKVTVVKSACLTGAQLTTLASLGKPVERICVKAITLRQTRPGMSAVDLTATARVFIDGTYEGDLIAAAGVPFRIGREGRDEYGEPLAPPQADGQLQGYNFRLIMTTEAANRVAVAQPAGYRCDDYTGIIPMLQANAFASVFGREGEKAIYKAQYPALPNGKFDINDVSHGAVRLSLPGENLDWPTGDQAARQAIFDRHMRWNVGLLWFLQNDPAVPESYRTQAARWGLCRDEFSDTNHLPPQLYIREARRMVGLAVFTETDTNTAPGDARAVLRTDAIAIGDYGHNCHGTGHHGSLFGGRHVGEFYKPVPPYQIPFGVLVCPSHVNLLSPVAVSASHVGFCALRLEPIWMSLGQAAGHAAAMAVAANQSVTDVSVPRLQVRLHAAGSATIYVSDVPPGHSDFAAVQWWGTAGGFHGLYQAPTEGGPRGPRILGQYYKAFPGHAAELDNPLTGELHTRWMRLAVQLGLPAHKLPPNEPDLTRRQWIRAAYALVPAAAEPAANP